MDLRRLNTLLIFTIGLGGLLYPAGCLHAPAPEESAEPLDDTDSGSDAPMDEPPIEISDFHAELVAASVDWVKRVGNQFEERISGAAVAGDDSFYATGYVFAPEGDPDDPDTQPAVATVFGADEPNETTLKSKELCLGIENLGYLARYEEDGTLIWAVPLDPHSGANPLDSPCNVFPSQVSTLPDGTVLIAGGFQGALLLDADGPSETLLETSEGQSAGTNFIAKFDDKGDLVWATVVCADAFESRCDLGGIVPLQDNSLLFLERHQIEREVTWHLTHTLADGTPDWSKQLPAKPMNDGVADDHRFSINPYDGNSIIMLQRVEGQDSNGRRGRSFLSRISHLGETIWEREITEFRDGIAWSMTSTADGHIALGGVGFANLNDEEIVPDDILGTLVVLYDEIGRTRWVQEIAVKDASSGYERWGRFDLHSLWGLNDSSVGVVAGFYDSYAYGPGQPTELEVTAEHRINLVLGRYSPSGTLTLSELIVNPGLFNDEGAVWAEEVLVGIIGQFSDGSLLLAGDFIKHTTFDPGQIGEATITSQGGRDLFLTRYIVW